jgi:hypothetical protein
VPQIGDKVTENDHIIHLRRFIGAEQNGMQPTYGVKWSRITGRKEEGHIDEMTTVYQGEAPA